MTQYSEMTNKEFIAYLKKYMIDGCHPQICTEAADRLEKALNAATANVDIEPITHFFQD